MSEHQQLYAQVMAAHRSLLNLSPEIKAGYNGAAGFPALQGLWLDAQILLDLEVIDEKYNKLLDYLEILLPGPAVTGFITFGKEPPMAAKLGDDKKIPLSATWLDKKGQPAVVDGATKWAVIDGTDVAHIEEVDGESFLVADKIGLGQVEASVDTKVGDEVNILTIQGSFEVTAGEAVSGSVGFGEPVDQ